jgi:hypothetical protein
MKECGDRNLHVQMDWRPGVQSPEADAKSIPVRRTYPLIGREGHAAASLWVEAAPNERRFEPVSAETQAVSGRFHSQISDIGNSSSRGSSRESATTGHAAAPGQTGDELPPLHCITSSAVANSVSGTVRPSAFAILWLITSSNLVASCTGKSAGLAPFRIRPT